MVVVHCASEWTYFKCSIGSAVVSFEHLPCAKFKPIRVMVNWIWIAILHYTSRLLSFAS